ncbi:MAG: hypothetical protein KAG20_08985, partial [Cocleimonas sp.]|nr:hypothetical protein [Cocleimonas sp.]
IMESVLAEKYPHIQTWKLYGEGQAVLSGRMDITPAGFHVMLSLRNGGTVFIDPENSQGQRYYRSQQGSLQHLASYQCQVKHKSASSINSSPYLQRKQAKSETTLLHTYRLAVAATAEYTQFFGGTVEQGLAAIVTTINRVNEIYERDLAIRLILIAENNQIIYTDSRTDPYTNSDSNLSSDQNQVNLDRVIGSNNYDIGHVFNTAGGGLAGFGVACDDEGKAVGTTGIDTPNSDVFYIDFVSHEIGHQLGADHTFNGVKKNCTTQNNAPTAYESGSGSTIMAYAGLCGSDNIQNTSDATFHSASIQQIMRYSRESTGASCATIKSMSNKNPVANAGNNYTIPARTPFVLTASATDEDNDTLTYAWDQMDAGIASSPDIDKGNNAIIRSYLPSTATQRMIPTLANLLAGTHTIGEILPTTTRALSFNLVVRDGKGGVDIGGIQLQVHDTGVAFSIKKPDVSTTVKRNENLSVLWEVASTDVSPINCSKVDIALSTDGGLNFKLLKKQVKNDGSEILTIPADTQENALARLKISCSDNIFFALSANNFAIHGVAKEITDEKKSAIGLMLPQLLLLLFVLMMRRRL